MVELTQELKIAVAQDELQQWLEQHYRLELRARGHKAAGNQRGLEAVAAELAVVEAMLDVLRAELAELESPSTGPSTGSGRGSG